MSLWRQDLDQPDRFVEIQNKIESYASICVFRHQNPDGDAFGSQSGLVSWLRERYPDKSVYVMGQQNPRLPGFFYHADDVSDEMVAHSLGIVVDCANASRIDDERFSLCQSLIKIDHHPADDAYATMELIDMSASSCAEILTVFIQQVTSGEVLSDRSASLLYAGIISDSQNFTIPSTTQRTFQCAAWLMNAHIDLPMLQKRLFKLNDADFQFAGFIREQADMSHPGFVYVILSADVLAKHQIDANRAKQFVNEFNMLRSARIWAVFTEERPGRYNGSLRSDQIVINDLAQQNGGGGHAFACAVNSVTREARDRLIDELIKRAAVSS